MSKLFEVEIRMTIIVQAEDESDAYLIARSNVRCAVSDSDPEIDVGDQISSIDELPSNWDGMCLPYGGDGIERIKDILP